jgi:hypothetical protein
LKKSIILFVSVLIFVSCQSVNNNSATAEKQTAEVKVEKSGASENSVSDNKKAVNSEPRFKYESVAALLIQQAYIKNVLNFTMEGTDKNVKLENEGFILILKAGMTFELTVNSETKIVKGRWGYSLDTKTMVGRMYFLILEDPSSMTKDEFLNQSNYTETSQIVLLPVSASENSVEYEIEKSSIDFSTEKLVFSKSIF